MALITSAQYENDFQAMWLADAKIPNRLRLTPASPEDNRRCFLNGTDEGIKRLSKMLDDSGYSNSFYPEEFGSLVDKDAAKLQDKPVFERAKRWLRHLETL